MIRHSGQARTHNIRRDFIGGSDARIIMGHDEKALIRLWQEEAGRDRAGGPLVRTLSIRDVIIRLSA
jgi:hypothetical protein